MDTPGFYIPVDKNNFEYERCFLCGKDFIELERTDEHIFPKWLQHRFNLWNESLHLLNNSLITYRYLTIPCCSECNKIHLSRMEAKFKILLDRNFSNLTKEEETTIFQWTAKILYGTLYKELSLLVDRKNKSLGTILPPEVIESYSALHLLLQSIRISTDFTDPKPWSIFVFSYQEDSFNYVNDTEKLCLSFQLGKVGVTITLEDNNVIEGFLMPLKRLQHIPLNDIQFYEVSSKVFYAKRLTLNVPFYTSAYHIISNTLRVTATRLLRGREWNDEEYGAYFQFLLDHAGFKLSAPVYENGLLSTFLVDNSGTPYSNLLSSQKDD